MTLDSLVKEGILTEESAAERACMPVEELRKKTKLFTAPETD